jgi:hypothetical protein
VIEVAISTHPGERFTYNENFEKPPFSVRPAAEMPPIEAMGEKCHNQSHEKVLG